jgi:hypothetical protein
MPIFGVVTPFIVQEFMQEFCKILFKTPANGVRTPKKLLQPKRYIFAS